MAQRRNLYRLLVVLSLLPWLGRANPGDVDPSFNPILNSGVSAICVQPDGKILIGGNFKIVNGLACNGIARLNPDGGLDSGFLLTPPETNSVFAIALQSDGKIVVAGSSPPLPPLPSRNHLARLNADGSLDRSFDAAISGLPAFTGCMAIQSNGAILLGGDMPSVIRLNADGSIDGGFAPTVEGFVESIAVQPDGAVILGGAFSAVNTNPCNNIARLDAAGNLDLAFASSPGLSQDVVAMALQPDGKILIGGGIVDSYNAGLSFGGFARLNADGTLDPTFSAASGSAAAIALGPGGKSVIGGSFQIVNGLSRVRIARLEHDGRVDTSFDPGSGLTAACIPICPEVLAVAVQSDGKILAGGSFTNANGFLRKYLVRLFGDPPPKLTSLARQADRTVALTGSAATNAQLRLDASTNLLNCSPLGELTNTTGEFRFTDESAASFDERFYRAVWLP